MVYSVDDITEHCYSSAALFSSCQKTEIIVNIKHKIYLIKRIIPVNNDYNSNMRIL